MKLRYHYFSLALVLALYLAMLVPFTDFMRHKPVLEKLGITPEHVAETARELIA